jgi:hypothetical protein
MEALGYVLAGLSLMVLVGVLILCYVVWRSNRRMDDAAAKAARKASGGKGEE